MHEVGTALCGVLTEGKVLLTKIFDFHIKRGIMIQKN